MQETVNLRSQQQSYHQPAHSLLLNSLILLFLFTLSIGMIGSHSFCKLLNFACDRSVVFFEILGMLKNTIEIFLKGMK